MRFLLAIAVLAGTGICQSSPTPKTRAVLVLCIDQPTRPFARDLLEGIQESTSDEIGLALFVDFLGTTALESETVASERHQLLRTKYANRTIEMVVGIGDRAILEAEKLRNELFPSANLLFLAALPNTAHAVRQGEGLFVDSSPWPALQLALSLMPERSQLVVASGTTEIDQSFRKAIADSLHLIPRKVEATYLNGLPLPELVETARTAPKDSIFVLTTNLVDRSGRSTTNVEVARELSKVGKTPLVEGTDLSLGQGSLGGDLVSYRLTGQEIGRRIRRTLDTGQAPAGVTIEPAPRRKVLDWRQLQRFGIAENRVPQGFEVLYRQPTLWEEHHTAILAVLAGLVLQTLLISFLLTERRRRAETQAKMQRQLKLEAMVSKASASLAAATKAELPNFLHGIFLGLSESIGIERLCVWTYVPDERDYAAIYWWPESRVPFHKDAITRSYPYLHGELLAGRTVTVARLEEFPLEAASDVAALQAQGFMSLLMMPLRQREVHIGALILGTYRHISKWDEEAVSTIRVLAGMLAQGVSRSMSEERVIRSEQQNRAMLAALPGFVLMIDDAGQILKQNTQPDRVDEELPKPLASAHLGQNLLKLWRADGEEAAGQVAQALEEILCARQTSLTIEHRYETQEGARWIEIHAESLEGERLGAVVWQTDITQRKNKESENAQNRQTAWHLNRVAALGELTASLAHEVNQPLAAILSSAEAAFALLNRPSPDIAETLEALRDIIDDDKRAGAIIGRMRSMLKRGIESTQPVDLVATVEETLRLVRNEARLRHVMLHHIATPGLPPVAADSTQLQQVILNLVTNGIEAAEIMTNYRQVEIQTGFVSGETMQFIEVRDSGPGIAIEKLQTIFEPFYTSKCEGLGLGLSICRSIVNSFGGRITVESPPDGGALFRVTLRAYTVGTLGADRVVGARA